MDVVCVVGCDACDVYVCHPSGWSYIIMYMSSKCMYMYCLHTYVHIHICGSGSEKL